MSRGGEGDPARALRLVAAGSALRGAIGVPLTVAEREQVDERLAEWRAVLGDERYAEAWAVGRVMAMEEAIEAALGEQSSRDRR